ncbi:polysaccharide biosynthesis tyrosine autokinase [Novosphingobium sp. RD2P27]|uniref:Polysaccharide biosynthesis tyrosine autokinase n=1 Tax=Novosphingobium kalidii TaxID=3230299 RepID=A0ABV2D5W3_9SPHN
MASIPMILPLPADGGAAAGSGARQPNGVGQQLSPHHIWNLIRRHAVLIAGVVIVCVTAVLIMQLRQNEVFEATSTVQVELNDSSGTNQADAARNLQRVANEARIYRSSALAEEVVKDLALDTNPVFTGNRAMTIQGAARQLSNQTRVISTNDSDFIDIAVRSPSPQLAQRIANQYVDSLRELRRERRQSWRDKLLRDIAIERERLAAELGLAERSVADFRRENSMLIGAGSAEDYQQINRIASEAASATAMQSASAVRSAGVSSAAQARTSVGATSPVLQQLERERVALAQQHSDLAVSLGSNHPRMQRLDAQINQVDADMARVRSSVISADIARNAADAAREQRLASGEAGAEQARAASLQSRVRQLTDRAFASNRANVDLAVLDRRVEVARQAYLTTAQRAQTIRAELDSTGINSSMVSAATVPTVPVAPTPKKAVLAALVGSFLLALLLVLAIEMFDNRLRTSDQLYNLYGLPTFAMLPKLSDSLPEQMERNPVLTEPQSLYAEVGRAFAHEVADLAHGTSGQSVLVTSPLPGDGKSSVSLTLAAAASALGRRAVVVDLDLRRTGAGVLRSIQSNSDGPSLLDYLTGKSELRDLLPAPHSADAVPDGEGPVHLPVVLSTPVRVPDPAALIRASQINRLLNDLREQFDLVVINAPAVLAVHDARTLSSVADATLIVVRWGGTTVGQMNAAMQMLQNGAVGAVINQVDYREHARRRYGGAVDYYMGAASYYSDGEQLRRGWLQLLQDRLRAFYRRATQ